MLALACALAIVAVLLAWPAPVALARAAWPSRAPARALLVWQAIGLAGGLSMIGALALAGLAVAPTRPALAVTPAAALAAYLLAHLAVVVVRVERQRRRHHALLELLSSPHPTRKRTRVLDDASPVAYCLPRGVRSLTVLSRGLLERLEPDELAAVVAHERAHVEQRHDVLLVAFRAWHAALPRFPVAGLAVREVAGLVELLADDSARRSVPDAVLARAILAVSAGRAAEAAEGAEAPRARDRVRRLGGGRATRAAARARATPARG